MLRGLAPVVFPLTHGIPAVVVALPQEVYSDG